MDSKLLKISMALCLCSCMSACDDGEYNNLDCDPNVYESECLSNNSYMYCRDGILTVVECGTQSVCQSKKKTHQDGTNEIVVSCAAIDQKPECTTNADCKDATKPVCSAQGVCVAAEQKPECTTSADCKDATKPVCSAQGVCVADETPTDTVDPCKDVTCTEGTCDRGVCVTDAMKNVKVGDECDGSFVDFCLGDSMVFCSQDGVAIESCAEDGGCALVKETIGGEEHLVSWCNGPSDKCTEDGQKIGYCADYSSELSYESHYLCVKNTEGKYTATDRSLYSELEICSAQCNAAKTDCAYEVCTSTEEATTTVCDFDDEGNRVVASKSCVKKNDGGLGYAYEAIQTCGSNCKAGACVPWFEGEGKPCKSSEYVDSCKGDDNNVVAYCYSGVITAENCEEDKCLTSKDGKAANCYGDDSLCETAGAKKSVCAEAWYGTWTSNLVCAEMSDGTKHWIADAEKGEVKCDLGCNGDKTGCGVMTDETGKACSANARAYCGKDKCAIVADGDKKNVVCYAETDVCTTAGASSSVCDKDKKVETTTTCTLAADGTTLIKLKSQKSCVLGCDTTDTTKCAPVAKGDGSCNDAAVALCQSDGAKCAVVAGSLKCYNDAAACETIGDTMKLCDDSLSFIGAYGVSTYKCTLADDQTTKIYVEDAAAYEDCDVICDPEQNACIENEAVEGKCSTLEEATCKYNQYVGCALVGGKAMCHDGACDTEGAISNQKCDTYDSGVYATLNKCVKADDGTFVFEYYEEKCADGCNEEGTACK